MRTGRSVHELHASCTAARLANQHPRAVPEALPTRWSIAGSQHSLVVQLAGAVIGPHALAVIPDVEGVRHLAELGVVFLLFNIGLELSLERLKSMQKYVFGMGTSQVRAVSTDCCDRRKGSLAVGAALLYSLWMPTAAGRILTGLSAAGGHHAGSCGGCGDAAGRRLRPQRCHLGRWPGLVLHCSCHAGEAGLEHLCVSACARTHSLAGALQVLADRGETGSRHGRAAFAILLLQASLRLSCAGLLLLPVC